MMRVKEKERFIYLLMGVGGTVALVVGPISP